MSERGPEHEPGIVEHPDAQEFYGLHEVPQGKEVELSIDEGETWETVFIPEQPVLPDRPDNPTHLRYSLPEKPGEAPRRGLIASDSLRSGQTRIREFRD